MIGFSVVKTWSNSRWAEFLIHPNKITMLPPAHVMMMWSVEASYIMLKFRMSPLWSVKTGGKFCVDFTTFVYITITYHYWYSTGEGQPFSVHKQWQLWALGAILHSPPTSKLHLSIPPGPLPPTYSTLYKTLYIFTKYFVSTRTISPYCWPTT